MISKNSIYRTLLFLVLMLSSPLSAVAASAGVCSTADVVLSQACIGEITNPKVDSVTWFNTYDDGTGGGIGAFNIDQWIFAEKIQNGDGGADPIRETTIDVGFMIDPPVDGEGKSGTWSLNSNIFNQYQNVAIVFKAGNGFTAYLLDGSKTSGTWNIQGWTRKGLSHASVYVTQAAVPVPAAVWLFTSGLVGLVTFSRRKMST